MENNNCIEFKKERDMGLMISDAFKFIRENWKDFFLSILKIVGPVLVVTLVVIIGYFFAMSDLFENIKNANSDYTRFFSGFSPWLGLLFLAYTLLYTLLSMSSLFFIKSYIEHKGKAVHAEVRQNVRDNFWKFIGYGLLMFFSVFVGAILCYLPGIWLYIVLSLGTAILVFEKKGIMETFSYSFVLIKNEWWNTFGVKIVIGLLIGVLSQIFAVPAFIYQIFIMATRLNEQDPNVMFGLFKDPIYLILNILSYSFQFILSSVSMIVGAFIYFDLNEKKNLSGTLERIESIGKTE